MPLSPPHLSRPTYRPDIDGLRALAVISVVAFHAFPAWVKGGFIGVDVFFVVSGYLISTLILENLDRGTFSFAEFYARRIRRIFPALLLVLAVSYVFGWFALLPDEYKQLGKHVAAAAGFVSNIAFATEFGYFDNSAAAKPLLHLWSLGIEEQFYMLWPLLLWLLWRRRFPFLTIALLIAAVSFYLNVEGAGANPIATFYSPHTRFWELLCGSVLAWVTIDRTRDIDQLKHRLAGVHAKFANAMSVAGLAMLAFGMWRIDKDVNFPGAWAAIPVLGTLLVMGAGPLAFANRVILSNKVAVWIGLISYPLYLWHWPLLSFAHVIEGDLPRVEFRIAAIALSVALAWLTYRFVERPIRFGGRSSAKVTVLVTLMIGIGAIGYWTYSKDGLPSRRSVASMNAVYAELVGPFWRYTTNNDCLSKYPLAGSERYGWWFCAASSRDKPTLLLLGNSHVNSFYPGIISNDRMKHHTVLSIGACDAGWIERSELSAQVDLSPCSGYRRLDQQVFINDIILKEKSVRYVIIAGLPDAPHPRYIERLRTRIDFLEKNGIRVILFMPHVESEYDIRTCYARPLRDVRRSCEISADVYRALRTRVQVLVDSIKTTNPDVLVFDPNVVLCDAERCHFKLPVMPAFREQFHFSEFASKLVMQKFVEWAETSVPGILSAPAAGKAD